MRHDAKFCGGINGNTDEGSRGSDEEAKSGCVEAVEGNDKEGTYEEKQNGEKRGTRWTQL